MRTLATLAFTVCGCAAALGQPHERVAFVGNNGTAEGSVSAFRFGPGGEPIFVQKAVTGLNAYALSVSPNGRWLAVTHETTSTTVENLDVFEVQQDATLVLEGTFTTPDRSIDCAWVTDEVLVIARQSVSGTNEVITYRFTPASKTTPAALAQVQHLQVASFLDNLAVHPNHQMVVIVDSDSAWLRSYSVSPLGSVTHLSNGFMVSYPSEAAITPDGRHVYVCSGTQGGNRVFAFSIDPQTGAIADVPGTPFVTGGATQAIAEYAAASTDGAYLFVGEKNTSIIRSMARSQTGALAPTGNSVVINGTNDLGGLCALDGLLLATDRDNGLWSFTIGSGGSMSANGGAVSTQGATPHGVAGWAPPPCYPDCNADNQLNLSDFGCFTTKFALGDPYADCNGDSQLNLSDFGCFQTKFALGCP